MGNDQTNKGFILLHRSICDHWIWKDANKLKWWLDILMQCNHSPRNVPIGYELIPCERGQSLYSLGTWAERWRVDISTVRRFLGMLQDDKMIITENLRKTTRLTVCNYDSYNDLKQPKQSQSNGKAISTQSQSNSETTLTKNDNTLNTLESIENINIGMPVDLYSFEKFYDLYGKKVGKVKAQKKWDGLTNDEKKIAMEHAPKYVQNTPDLQFRQNPATYLHQKSFNDEIIKSNGQQRTGTAKPVASTKDISDFTKGL